MAARRRTRRVFKFKYRLVFQNFRFRRSPLDLWLGLFLITVLLGVWYSFSARMALFKFWMVVASLALYYVITAVRRRYAWWVVGFCGPVTAVLALYFISANVWLRGLMIAGGFFRPLLSLAAMQRFWPLMTPHPNVIGGLIAMFLPFIVAYGVYVRRKEEKRQSLFWITAVSCLMAITALLLTKAVAAWLALAAGSAVWLLWLAAKPLSGVLRLSRKVTYWLLLGVTAMGGIILLQLIFQTNVPAIEALGQRYSLMEGSRRLIQDYAFTGSGLSTFPALYAEYIQVVPNFFVSYSNFYLDVFLELGFWGFLFLFAAWLTAFGQLLKALQRSIDRPADARGQLYWLRWATLVSMLVILLHGLSDDMLFGGLGTPFLFFTPAIAILVSRRQSSYEGHIFPAPLLRGRSLLLIGAAFVLLLGLVFVYRQNLTATWLANQAALKMDQVLMQRWPQNEWREKSSAGRLRPARAQFEEALVHDPHNRTAHQRLGMMAYLARDFDTAVAHLSAAYEKDQNHRGLRKMLGYSYVWLGQFEMATPLLEDIPESQAEMEAYTNWWRQLDQAELAQNARTMMTNLEE